jgi:ComF family protein
MDERILKVLERCVDTGNFLLWPAKCTGCGRSISESDGLLCRKCWQLLAASLSNDYCPGCGRDVSDCAVIDGRCPECEQIDLVFEKIARVGRYESVLRNLILTIKHTESPQIYKLLSYHLLCTIEKKLPVEQIDFFTPVPLHWSRRIVRGYNQSSLLMKKVGTRASIVDDILIRNRRTKPQPGLTYAQKCKNIKGAFTCIAGRKVEGKTICIVDDIKTTGATLSECSRVLKKKGAARIYAAVIAVAHA